MVGQVVSKVVCNGEVQGYMIKYDKEKEACFRTIKDLIYVLQIGSVTIPGVKVTANGKLMGCNGFQLSKVPTIKLKDLSTVNADLLSVLRYTYKNICPKGNEETKFSARQEGVTAYYTVHTRKLDYYNMSHMAATDDLCGYLEYIMENLPKDLQGLADDLAGEVGEKGYISITAYKKLI